MKIANRFNDGSIITVHDELLMDLYKLNISHAEYTLKEKVINGKRCIINSLACEGKYEIGLVAFIPDDIKFNNIYEFIYEDYIDKDLSPFYEKLKDQLFFTSDEVLIANILFSDYLNKSVLQHLSSYQISFKDFESYRSKSSIERGEVLKDITSNKYRNIMKSLCRKNIYLKTSDKFRAECYGVRNREIFQPFITVGSVYTKSKNNYVFNYSFGNFGKFICRSRRFSNLLPSNLYKCNFNQTIKIKISTFIAQQLYYAKFKLSKSKYNVEEIIINAATMSEWVYSSYNITSKMFNRFRKYLIEVLDYLKEAGEIDYYSVSKKFSKGRQERRSNTNCVIKMIKKGINIGNVSILESNSKEQKKTETYPSISSYVLLMLPTGSKEGINMKYSPLNPSELKKYKDISTLYKRTLESGDLNG